MKVEDYDMPEQRERIYVTGHRHPDTDSVAAAIAYAFYKRAMGYRAVPCRLGPVNAESRYLLERFHFREPELLEDARVRLLEIPLDPPTGITKDTTIFDCMQKMQETGKTYSEYLTDVRIRKAKDLLVETGDSIGMIAEKTGYHDARYFSKQFSRIVGLKPFEYRKLYS